MTHALDFFIFFLERGGCSCCYNRSALILSFLVFPSMQNDKKKIQELSCEVQMKEEWLREERMERERLEAQLGGVQEQNRVSEPMQKARFLFNGLSGDNHSQTQLIGHCKVSFFLLVSMRVSRCSAQ